MVHPTVDWFGHSWGCFDICGNCFVQKATCWRNRKSESCLPKIIRSMANRPAFVCHGLPARLMRKPISPMQVAAVDITKRCGCTQMLEKEAFCFSTVPGWRMSGCWLGWIGMFLSSPANCFEYCLNLSNLGKILSFKERLIFQKRCINLLVKDMGSITHLDVPSGPV